MKITLSIDEIVKILTNHINELNIGMAVIDCNEFIVYDDEGYAEAIEFTLE